MSIDDKTLRQDIFTSVRNVLVQANIVITNSSTSATTAAAIEATYNDKDTKKPCIVITPALVTEDGWKFNSDQGHKLINVIVDCYAGNTLYADQLADQVADAIKEYNFEDVALVGVEQNYNFNGFNQNKFHLVSNTFIFDKE